MDGVTPEEHQTLPGPRIVHRHDLDIAPLDRGPRNQHTDTAESVYSYAHGHNFSFPSRAFVAVSYQVLAFSLTLRAVVCNIIFAGALRFCRISKAGKTNWLATSFFAGV
jgi:hypothetical protein